MKKIMKALIIALIFLPAASGCSTTLEGTRNSEMWNPSQKLVQENFPALEMPADRDFRILVLADIQLESSPLKDPKALRLVKDLAEQNDPDLILTVGDNTSWVSANVLAEKLVETFTEIGKPWAVVLGNHDAEGKADRYWHGNLYEQAPHSLFQSGPSNIHGVGNFAIRLVDKESNLKKLIVMMDSNEKIKYPDGSSYEYIYFDQIEWYKWLIKGFEDQNSGSFNSLAFFHIPLPEFQTAIDAWEAGEIASDLVFGEYREKVCSAPVNSGFFNVIKEAGNTTHIFNGHDHVNNISIPYEGIRMTYVQKSGPGSYSDPDLRGGTLLTISAETGDVTIKHIKVDQ